MEEFVYRIITMKASNFEFIIIVSFSEGSKIMLNLVVFVIVNYVTLWV